MSLMPFNGEFLVRPVKQCMRIVDTFQLPEAAEYRCGEAIV
jgi:hypothetical protein